MPLQNPALTPRIWQVGALCRAVAEVLDASFNPVAVVGEISGFSRAASGHCYFSLKDESGQLRCAMFRRAASLLDFAPRDGDRVELRGRLGLYEARGELQLVVEAMRKAGQGELFEQFLRLKARLSAEGLFDADRKKPLPLLPRSIGLVTSLGAAALHDVLTALQRRAPHVRVVIAPAAVQGASAAAELVKALSALYAMDSHAPGEPPIDLILLVRGGGSMEDLWPFNDELLARTLAQSPVPVISGVGHETDFTIADFVADLRAPTPTAAAELAAQPLLVWLAALDVHEQRLGAAAHRLLDKAGQRLDLATSRLGRPLTRLAGQHMALNRMAQTLQYASRSQLLGCTQRLQQLSERLTASIRDNHDSARNRMDSVGARLHLLDPNRVLQRGYAWLTDARGQAISSVSAAAPGQLLSAQLADGRLDLKVLDLTGA